MSRAWIRALVVLFMVGTFCAERLPGCSCVMGHSGANSADLKPIGPSFIGTVIEIGNPPDERRGADQSGLSRYRFRIDENISGFEQKEVDIYSGRGSADCSYHFKMGQPYFVAPFKGTAGLMALYGAEPGKMMAGICTATQPTASATARMKYIRARKRGGATVVGVLRTEPGPDDYNHRIPNATVELRTADITLSTQTDIDGVYQFYEVSRATYQFAAKLPADFEVAADKAAVLPSITIADESCYAKDIYVVQTALTDGP
jgi:hypothetical protein